MTPKRHSPIFISSRGVCRARRGGVTAGLLITLSLLSTLMVTAVVVSPRYLAASDATGDEGIRAVDPAHRQVAELLGSIISRSRQVIAIHPRGASPYLELVLWLEDGENRGVMDPTEIAILSHSELLQTIVLHAAAEDEGEESGLAALTSDIRDPGFCPAWRRHAGVSRTLLARRIAAMEAEVVKTSQNSAPLLRISLTWAAEWADSPDEASVLLDVAMRQSNDA